MSANKLAVVGTGVIGNGWIARGLAKGYDVIAYDPAEGAKEQTHKAIENAWPALEKIGLAPGASKERLKFVDDLPSAVTGANLIQENVPEREQLKRQVLAEIDEHAHSEAIIASSTSGIIPSTLQKDCRHNPERVIVAHPFNPVHLLPLVELVGGEQTSSVVINQAYEFYQRLEMRPLVVKQEIEGHIADRLMEALWREALHIVNDGVATTKDVDDAVVYGPGLRWALMGTFMTFHLAGGEGGMRHMLHQFGPALKKPWTKLEAPELTDELADRVINGCESQAGDTSIKEWERQRDEFLVKLLDLVKEYWPEQEDKPLDGQNEPYDSNSMSG
ncbi:L-carnitine dehydrogenase [Natranaerobius thermophilus]|uniref:L-carnitine dehydrogenase n=1 Tax=Natranaerobius thermophilus TaxID=375929 RepID=UPI002F402A6D